MNPNTNKGPRACITCAKAKSRCVPGPTEDKCERCHRLNKSCGTQTPAPPRKRKEPRVTKVQALEQRLEYLSARLEASKEKAPASGDFDRCVRLRHLFPGADDPAASNLSPPSTEAVPSETLTSASSATPLTVPSVAQNDAEPPSQTVSSPPSPPTPISPSPNLFRWTPPKPNSSHGPVSIWPSGALADHMLSVFRTYSAPLFPFVIIPPGSSPEVQRKNPFVWKAVMMHSSGHSDCSGNASKQVILGSEMIKEVSSAAFIMARKSMDLLQGLEVMIAWYHYSLNSFQVTNLLFLARSMAAGMGLAEKATEAEKMMEMGKLEHIKSEDLEGLRALCGAYYLNTLVFTVNKKLDNIMSPAPLESACRVLESRMEHPSDQLLVHLIRIQILAHSITSALANNNQVPLTLIAKPFQDQLDAFRASIPQSLKANPTLNLHISIAIILLYESSISSPPSTYFLPHSSSSGQSRIQHLYFTLQAAKSYIATRFAPSPLSPYYGASPGLAPHPLRESGSRDAYGHPKFVCLTTFDFAYVFITCLRLVLTSAPGWDVGVVKRELMLEPLIERQVRELDRFTARRICLDTKACMEGTGGYGGSFGAEDEGGMDKREKGEHRIEDPFYRMGMKLRVLKTLFRVEEEDGPAQTTTAQPQLHSAVSQQGRMVMETPPPLQPPQLNVDSERLGEMQMDWQNVSNTATVSVGSGMHVGLGDLDDGMHMDMDINAGVDGFDPNYWQDLFSEDAMRFYLGGVELAMEGMAEAAIPEVE